MKKVFISLIVICLVFAFTLTRNADALKVGLGLGYLPNEATSIDGRFWINDMIAAQLSFGLAHVSSELLSATDLSIGFGGRINVSKGDRQKECLYPFGNS